MRDRNKTRRAFTLIELLTVIAIIGVLVALLFPAIQNSMRRAEAAKAQTGISGLATAFQHYYTEYGHWPVADSLAANSNMTYIVDTNFVALLQGSDNRINPIGSANLTGPFALNIVVTSALQGNPRGIRFLEFKQADLDPVKGYVDPWKQPYYCRFDMGYYNNVGDPFYPLPSGVGVNTGFVIWSAGPDAQYDANNQVAPAVVSPLNKDNIKSW